MDLLGASIFPVDAIPDLIDAITSVITDNIVAVLALFGFFLGLRIAFRMLNKGSKGKIGI